MSAYRDERSNKILVLANNDVGLYQFRRELLQALLDKGNEICISLPDGAMIEPMKAMGCKFINTPIDRRGINPKTDGKLVLMYRKMLKTLAPDLVITYTIKPNIYGGIACRMKKIPYAINITGLGTAFQGNGMLKKFVVMLYKIALKKAKIVFFENAGNMQTLLDLGICRKEQTCLLNGAGVNLSHYGYVKYPTESRTRFLFIGRVMREKGVDELFTAMRRLTAEGADCVLDVVGPYEDNYEQTIRACEAEGWLQYHGYQKDVRPYIHNAHCFVLPSWHEGMANTNLECAASGRPLITSDIPGCREAVAEGKSGLLCKAKDADSLYEAMKNFLCLSFEERQAMGRAGRAHMETVFDKEKVVNETISALYR